MIGWRLGDTYVLFLEKARKFSVKPSEKLFRLFIQTLWVLDKRNTIYLTICLLGLIRKKLIKVAIALNASYSERDIQRRIIK